MDTTFGVVPAGGDGNVSGKLKAGSSCQTPTPLIENNPLIAQNDNTVPGITGRNAVVNAHQSSRDKGERLRCPIKMRTKEKHMAGAAVTISIQSNGVADQSFLNLLVA